MSGGVWSVVGGALNGTISSSGLYTAPAALPTGPVDVHYAAENTSADVNVTILNPVPVLTGVTPDLISAPSTTITVTGSQFTQQSEVLVDGQTVTTQFVDPTHLRASLSVPDSTTSSLTLAVETPAPGEADSTSLTVPVKLSQMKVSPAALSAGPVTVSVDLTGIGSGSRIELNGVALTTISTIGTVVTGTGVLPPWVQGEVPIAVTSPDGSTILAESNEAITPTAASFDTAARFSTQAAWGPRPDVVLHIQQVGLEQFVAEQLAAPVGAYDVTTTNPMRSFFLNVTSGNSLLRLRTAWAFQTFIPGQIYFSDHNKALPWEQTLERDAFSNYRNILRDAVTDPNIAFLLNLEGSAATNSPYVHPNQNFAREMMQLFSTGSVMLNQDGTPKLDANGQRIPAYDEPTVIDMSRVLTGWVWAPVADGWFTYAPWGIDFSQPLITDEAIHDHGSKTLFGQVTIPAGQTVTQDRDAAIEAIMNHPNTAPFVSQLLIQRLTKSQPSPAYVQRVAKVFENDGTGVNGNLAAVITAILLDPEARAGDSVGDPTDGFLQDPLYQQMFLMSVLQISGEDDQSTYIFNGFSEQFWNPGTVFAYFSPTYTIPGTAVVSPEFQLLTNFTDIQRSQFLYGVVLREQPGFNNGFNGWLYDNFKTLPSMTDALNHLLYHGTMSAAEQTAIQNYCSGIADPQLQMESAVFLALNGDSYLVSH